MTDRNKVGEADPETRRKMLREALDKPTRAEGFKRSEPPKPKKKAAGGLRDLLDPNKPRERRVEREGENVDDYVKRAIDGAPKP